MAFLFLRKRRVLRLVERSLPTLRKRIRQMTPSERCATMALCSATMLSLGKQRGLPIVKSPHKIDPEAAIEVIDAIVAGRESALARLDQFQDNVSAEMANQAIRQVLAFEVVIVTLALSLEMSLANRVKAVWLDLMTGRKARKGAMESLMRFARETRASPLPLVEGKTWSVAQVDALLVTPPPFLGMRTPVAA